MFTSGALVEDVGTHFGVAIHADRIAVSVSDGVVSLNPGSVTCANRSADHHPSPRGPVILKRGERADLVNTNDGTPIHRLPFDPVEVRRSMAWLPTLHVTGRALAEALEQFNRYNCQEMTVVDPNIAGIRVGGDWDATATAEFLAAIEAAHHIRPCEPFDAECRSEAVTLTQQRMSEHI